MMTSEWYPGDSSSPIADILLAHLCTQYIFIDVKFWINGKY